VLVVSVRALKRHGEGSDRKALQKGLENLEKHLENLAWFQVPVIVAINQFTKDTDKDFDFIEEYCSKKQVPCAVVDVWGKGGEGGIELAGKLISLIYNTPSRFTYLYDLDLSVKEKIEIIAKKMYGADRVGYSVNAENDIKLCGELGLDSLPICIAKTPYSLSDNPLLLGRPTGFKITVRDIKFSAGAGFLVPMTGKITTMPGLPPNPQSESMDIDKNGNIIGLS
jgi:formate--tetrahydrofolate ligase